MIKYICPIYKLYARINPSNNKISQVFRAINEDVKCQVLEYNKDGPFTWHNYGIGIYQLSKMYANNDYRIEVVNQYTVEQFEKEFRTIMESW